MNHITTSTGERITRTAYDFRIRKAKEMKRYSFINQHGDVYCEECGANESSIIYCSHDIPVSECIKNGYSEKAYAISNITLRCKDCHKKKTS